MTTAAPPTKAEQLQLALMVAVVVLSVLLAVVTVVYAVGV